MENKPETPTEPAAAFFRREGWALLPFAVSVAGVYCLVTICDFGSRIDIDYKEPIRRAVKVLSRFIN